MAKLTQAERTQNRMYAKTLAQDAEEEMKKAHADGDADKAALWRDIADVAWGAVETGEPIY